MLVNQSCRNCGGPLDLDSNRVDCKYCGTPYRQEPVKQQRPSYNSIACSGVYDPPLLFVFDTIYGSVVSIRPERECKCSG